MPKGTQMHLTFPAECGPDAPEVVKRWLRETARDGLVTNASHHVPSPGKVLFLLTQIMSPADFCIQLKVLMIEHENTS